jgi:hypothetical protein
MRRASLPLPSSLHIEARAAENARKAGKKEAEAAAQEKLTQANSKKSKR